MNLGGAVHINKTGIVVIVVVFFLLLIYINSRGDSQSGEHVSSTINLKKLVQVAVKAAENGGVEVVKGSKHDLKVIVKGKTKEGLDDKVTPADRMSNCAMVAVLKSAFPTLTVISEEETTDCNTNERLGDNLEPVDLNDEIVDEKDLTIWIDPLDATYEYTHRLHQYVTTMVCVAFKGKPIIGVIHNPFLKNTSWAWVGHGMSSNLKKITLPSLDSQKKVTVVVSMSHAGDVKEILQKHFKDKELEIKTAAGAGEKNCMYTFSQL